MPLVGIGTLPTPFWPASVPLPPETGGRGHTSQGVGGWGESQFRRGAYTVVLFICTYFVDRAREKECICLLSWSVHYNSAGDGSCRLMMEAVVPSQKLSKLLTVAMPMQDFSARKLKWHFVILAYKQLLANVL